MATVPRAPTRPSHDSRPARSYGDRPDRGDRPTRSYDRPDHADRAPRRESDFYPNRDDKTGFAPHEDVVLERLEAQVLTATEADGAHLRRARHRRQHHPPARRHGGGPAVPDPGCDHPRRARRQGCPRPRQTGSGKTIAFGAPLVERLMENNGAKDRKQGRKPRALILAPTRELAMQIDRTVQPIARSVGLFTVTIFGGVPQYRQVSARCSAASTSSSPPPAASRTSSSRAGSTSARSSSPSRRGRPHVRPRLPRAGASASSAPRRPGGQKLLFSATLDGRREAGQGATSSTRPCTRWPARTRRHSTIDHRVLLIEQRDKGADHRAARIRRRQDPDLRPHPRVRRAARRPARGRRHPRRPACTATSTSPAAPATSRSSPAAASTCWWRRMSPPAASTSTTSRWSSRPMRRTSTSPTCTAPAAPAAPASRAPS